jgi:hypothetical protein
MGMPSWGMIHVRGQTCGLGKDAARRTPAYRREANDQIRTGAQQLEADLATYKV